MKRINISQPILFCFLLYVLGICVSTTQAHEIILRGGWVFDSENEKFVENDAIVIRAGHFSVLVKESETGAII